MSKSKMSQQEPEINVLNDTYSYDIDKKCKNNHNYLNSVYSKELKVSNDAQSVLVSNNILDYANTKWFLLYKRVS